MSIFNASAFHGSPDPEIDATPQTKKPPKSVTGEQPSHFETSKQLVVEENDRKGIGLSFEN